MGDRMKKSEMTNKMAKYWTVFIRGGEVEDIHSNPDLFDEVKEKMEQILSFIEFEGMLPPSTNRGFTFVNRWDCEEMNIPDEDEDEKV
jgi:hypothetical protein